VRYFEACGKCCGYSPYGFIAAAFSTNPEAKHFPSISLISIAVIVIPIKKIRSWNVEWVRLRRIARIAFLFGRFIGGHTP
jgi:hypothetical protein